MILLTILFNKVQLDIDEVTNNIEYIESYINLVPTNNLVYFDSLFLQINALMVSLTLLP